MLERAIVAGLAQPERGADLLADDLAGHLRALLRDVLCGHLDSDLRTLADELLAESAAAPAHDGLTAPARRGDLRPPHAIERNRPVDALEAPRRQRETSATRRRRRARVARRGVDDDAAGARDRR